MMLAATPIPKRGRVDSRATFLQHLMGRADLDADELADRSGFEATTIRRILRADYFQGRSECSRDGILRIAETLILAGAPWAETMAWVVACGYSPFSPGQWPAQPLCEAAGLDRRVARALLSADRETQREVARAIRLYLNATTEAAS